jgi:hypothetical protein
MGGLPRRLLVLAALLALLMQLWVSVKHRDENRVFVGDHIIVRGFARDTTRVVTAQQVRQDHDRWLDAAAAAHAIS